MAKVRHHYFLHWKQLATHNAAAKFTDKQAGQWREFYEGQLHQGVKVQLIRSDPKPGEPASETATMHTGAAG
jgi:hypothetical protein